jgi:hypothetical protein
VKFPGATRRRRATDVPTSTGTSLDTSGIVEFGNSLLSAMYSYLTLSEDQRIFNSSVLGIFLWTTYLTSIWLWLFVASGVFVRTLSSFERISNFLKIHLNLEEKPISSMGFVAGGMCALLWWGGCLVSWRRSSA